MSFRRHCPLHRLGQWVAGGKTQGMQSLTQGLLPWHCKTNGSGHKRRTLHQSDAHTLDWPGGRKTKIIHCTKTKRHKQSHQRFLLNPESHLRTEPSAPACPKQSHLLPDLPCLSAVETERLQMWGGASDLFFFFCLPDFYIHPHSHHFGMTAMQNAITCDV